MSLFWRIFTVNASVFAVGTAVLALSPVTVSFPIAVTEAVILTVGLSIMLVANALLLRWGLRPLERLRARMGQVDLLHPGGRLPVPEGAGFAVLVRTFNEMLDRLEAERKVSAQRALGAQEDERRRVSRDLHDEVGQALSAVLLQLGRSLEHAPVELRDELLAAQETVRASLGEVHRIMSSLRPGALEDLGLVSAISALSNAFAERTGIVVERRLASNLPALPEDGDLALYRVAQESLTNIARHAGATRVDITLERGSAGVRLRIDDNGTGLNGAPEGGGIRGMRERALLYSASLVLSPRPGGGTRVQVEIPLTNGSTR